jgi:hypothetical protein
MAAAAHHGLPMISMSGADIYSPYVGTSTIPRQPAALAMGVSTSHIYYVLARVEHRFIGYCWPHFICTMNYEQVMRRRKFGRRFALHARQLPVFYSLMRSTLWLPTGTEVNNNILLLSSIVCASMQPSAT